MSSKRSPDTEITTLNLPKAAISSATEESTSLAIDDEAPLVTRVDEQIDEVPKPARSDPKPTPKLLHRLKEAYDIRKNLLNLITPASSEAQLPVLDGIRGFAMIWVMLTHSWIFLSWRHTNDPGFNELQFSYALRFIRSGELSVDMFFVLSGFLIGHILVREHEKTGTVNLRSFYFRRFLRISPAYYTLILVYWPILELINCPNCKACTNTGWANFVFVNNFIPSFFSCMGWTWSIAVEVQFYVVSPFIMWVFNKNRKLGFVLLGVLSVVMLAVRGLILYFSGAMSADAGSYMDIMYTKPYTRVGPYLVGLTLAGLYAVWRAKHLDYRPSKTHNMLWLASICVSLAVMVVLVIFGPGFGYDRPFSAIFIYGWVHRTLWGVCVALIVFLCLVSTGMHQAQHGQAARPVPIWQRVIDVFKWFMSWRIWWTSAQLSYCAYLLHPMWITIFYLILLPDFQMTFWIYCGLAAVNLIVSNLAALPLHLLVERPFMNLRY